MDKTYLEIQDLAVREFVGVDEFRTGDLVSAYLKAAKHGTVPKLEDSEISTKVSSVLQNWHRSKSIHMRYRLNSRQEGPRTARHWSLVRAIDLERQEKAAQASGDPIEILAQKENGDMLIKFNGEIYKATRMEDW